MTAPELLFDGPASAPRTIALAHGAGAPMDSPFMAAFADGLAAAGFRVARFEFPYMARRRHDGTKRPPDRGPVLVDTWRTVVGALGADGLVIGGKSLGGRIASMVADEMGVAGLAGLGYPFHAPDKPMNPERLAHMQTIKTPTLICQGTRDALGSQDDLTGVALSGAIGIHWLDDGDHGFKPRKASGLTEDGNWQSAIAAVSAFAHGL